ncbi:gliding motility protein GldM [Kordia sp. YSTF-M3]|uniref:Gliding motility protein GldM n=1 Tax=Kordia aestuariivivens TaxID=2759037 RepID=A0ABR7QDX5_9FLAO|nr:gliding motility protein GldM [Kordia aestuariivivens]MBC8756780.1 gliding motility protein GldM [Kordia aestuariivivens]
MAGGKQSARQKMINLMYLVFIAMIAMTMTKEVLSAFGSMNSKFVSTNELTDKSNETLLKGLEQKAEEKVEFKVPAEKAKVIKGISDRFNSYLADLKKDIVEGGGYEREENGDLPYEQMDKGDYLDEQWFTGDRLTIKGDSVMASINKYKSDIRGVLGNDESYRAAIENFEKRFDLSDITNEEGDELGYLDYNFKGFPAIASYAKITAMQNDVKTTEANLYNLFLGNSLDEAITLKNYTAIVIPDKNAFFAGEEFRGTVVLGKYADVTPSKLNVNGKDISLTEEGNIDSVGNARLKFKTGNVGEHEVKGVFTFVEKGEELPIPFVGNYVVVPRPNSATISADKMNVVYRGVDNPMTISFAGVSDNKVSATAPGLNKVSTGKYNMKPQGGAKVTISVSATLDDGTRVGDNKEFRIKEIPAPTGYFRGVAGSTKMSKSGVEKGTVQAKLDDFDFDLPLRVTQFDFKVPGQPTITVNGSKLDSRAKSALNRAKRGQTVQILNIKAKSSGPLIKRVAPVIIEITN